MVESFLDYSLGPHGRYIGGLLLKYQFPVYCAIFAFVFYGIFRSLVLKKGKEEKHD